MLKSWLILSLLILAGPAMAQIYKIVHPDGRVEYTDEAPENQPVQPVELPQLILQPGVPIPAQPQASDETNSGSDSALPASISLSSPQDETVVHGSGRSIELVVNALNRPDGSLFKLEHNGAQVLTSEQNRFNSPVLFAGTQTFRVSLVSAQGDSLASSAPVRIYVIP